MIAAVEEADENFLTERNHRPSIANHTDLDEKETQLKKDNELEIFQRQYSGSQH